LCHTIASLITKGPTTVTDAEQIAAFLAKKPVTKVAEGERTLTRYDLYLAVRGEVHARPAPTPRVTTARQGADRLAAVGHDGHEFWVNADGERLT
jgi:hypothetical protein